MTPETVRTIRHALTMRVNQLDDAAREAEERGMDATAANPARASYGNTEGTP